MMSVIVFASVSCSLEEDPEYFVNKDDFYKNKEQCVSAVNACYNKLNSIYTFRMLTLTDAHSDLIYEPAPTVTEARMELSPAQPGGGESIWLNCYQMIMYANSAFVGVQGSPLDDDEKNALLAEIVIMRAFYYYLLTSFWGDVPFYTEDVSDTETMNRIARLPRMSAVETRAALIKELNEYIHYLPQVRTSENEGNRAGAAVGLMLVAKMAMWNAAKDTDAESDTYWYDIALEALGALEDIYGDLAQYPLEDIKFRYKNTPESIFEVQHTYTPGGVIYTSNLACVCMPYQTTEERGSNVFDGVEVTLPCWEREFTFSCVIRPQNPSCSYLQEAGCKPSVLETKSKTLSFDCREEAVFKLHEDIQFVEKLNILDSVNVTANTCSDACEEKESTCEVTHPIFTEVCLKENKVQLCETGEKKTCETLTDKGCSLKEEAADSSLYSCSTSISPLPSFLLSPPYGAEASFRRRRIDSCGMP